MPDRTRSLALVEAYYAAFNRGDHAGMLALLADDVAHDPNQGPRETGKAAFAAFLARMDRHYREQLRDIVATVADDGRRAGVEYTVHGEYLVTDAGLPEARGQRYVLPGGAFFDIVEGPDGSLHIARVTNYYNLRDWVSQVAG